MYRLDPRYWVEYSKYLFEKPFNFTKLWCRMRYHPAGYTFYNAGGLEPDYSCANCGDIII